MTFARLAAFALLVAVILAMPASHHVVRLSPAGPASASRNDPADRARAIQAHKDRPLVFEANQGQTASEVSFVSRGNGYTAFFTATEVVMAFTPRRTGTSSRDHARAERGRLDEAPVPSLRMRLLGAAPAPRVTGQGRLPGTVNYFIGRDPGKWRSNVPTYASVKYESVYPGIDILYYGNRRQLEYDFIVAPGVDPRVITLSFDGARRLEVDAQGDLLVHADGGVVRQRKPHIYQGVLGVSARPVSGRYTLKGRNQVGFHVGSYDPTRALIIDPILVYATYLGGREDDIAGAIAIDAVGNAYMTGWTASFGFPTTPAAFSAVSRASLTREAFVAKLSPDGALVYSTYLGSRDEPPIGEGNDTFGNGIAVDAAGNAYVVGDTTAPDFPTTPGAFERRLAPGSSAFVTKLNPEGSALLYSTFLGRAIPRSIAVDRDGNAYVAGATGAPDFPTTISAFQRTFGGGEVDGFVTRLNSAGSALMYSSFLGGSRQDVVSSIALDTLGNAYVTGWTGSADFPVTGGAFQAAFGGGMPTRSFSDAFVAKIATAQSGRASLVYSTYLGGSGDDDGAGIAVDAAGNAYVAGITFSTDFPIRNPIQPALTVTFSGFLTKLNALGSSVVYSTYFGGVPGGESESPINSVAVDAAGNAYLTGSTNSFDFPTTVGGGQTGFDVSTAYVASVDPTGTALVYSVRVGGSRGGDTGFGIAVDAVGTAYVAGVTHSADFPTLNPVQHAIGGGKGDAFAVKISAPSPGLVPLQFVNFPPGFPSLPPTGKVGVPYVGNIGIGGGVPPYTVTLVSGALPAGLRFGSPVISGTPIEVGTARFTARVQSADNLAGALRNLEITIEALVEPRPVPVRGDFDGDRRDDLASWRASDGAWSIVASSTGAQQVLGWGASGDIPVPGDYDGDGKTDVAVWRPASGAWFIIDSRRGVGRSVGWGAPGDIPVPGDYDGDGVTDIAVFRPDSGAWFIVDSSRGIGRAVGWGAPGDVPLPGDYDGDGRTDIAVFRPSTGAWFIIDSSRGIGRAVGWGAPGDVPVPGDYDGDGKTDIAVFRPSAGAWFIIDSSTGAPRAVGWSAPGGRPAPGDYNGDRRADIAVFRPSTSDFLVRPPGP